MYIKKTVENLTATIIPKIGSWITLKINLRKFIYPINIIFKIRNKRKNFLKMKFYHLYLIIEKKKYL